MLRFARRFAACLAPLRESRCASCATPVPLQAPDTPFGATLCPSCAAALARRTAGYCTRCGNLFAQADAPPAPCGNCLAAPRPWNRFFFHGAYQGLLRDLILRFKNGHELALGNLLGRLLAAHPDIPGPPDTVSPYDAIVPMPLHPRRLRERGFNQALEAALPLAAKCGAPVMPQLLGRTGYTRPQAGLSLNERKANVRGLFAAKGAAGMRLLLADDIATTCASLESAADALLRAGASSVDVAVIARTPEARTLSP
ncbi:Phosphoribosyltransferase [uncultured delta proteobacterium]|uniref:Phosphoribosyltransferase n=1 Tax=uncultured delta proteobacterium TaxID=34034 RepID=A0A212K170_9DELT|nr:Phosphoribosyltransferase [uncultured delta proteobacterium]